MCACFIQNCEYLFTSTLKSQESLRRCECACTWVCACVLGVEAGPLRGPAWGRAERRILCIWPARGPREPSSAGTELLKAETDCAVLLSTVVALWTFLNF